MTTATMAMRAMMPTMKPEPFSFGFLIFWLAAHTIAATVERVTPSRAISRSGAGHVNHGVPPCQGRTANRSNGRHAVHAAIARKRMSRPIDVR